MTTKELDLLTPIEQEIELVIAMYARSKKEEMHLKIVLQNLVKMVKKEVLTNTKS